MLACAQVCAGGQPAGWWAGGLTGGRTSRVLMSTWKSPCARVRVGVHVHVRVGVRAPVRVLAHARMRACKV
eukprot:12351272-Alexandrium_andersonii.AAC.1